MVNSLQFGVLSLMVASSLVLLAFAIFMCRFWAKDLSMMMSWAISAFIYCISLGTYTYLETELVPNTEKLQPLDLSCRQYLKDFKSQVLIDSL